LYRFHMSCPDVTISGPLKYCIDACAVRCEESTDTVPSNFWLKSNVPLKFGGIEELKVVLATQAAVRVNRKVDLIDTIFERSVRDRGCHGIDVTVLPGRHVRLGSIV
jgi:hypothetical protein